MSGPDDEGEPCLTFMLPMQNIGMAIKNQCLRPISEGTFTWCTQSACLVPGGDFALGDSAGFSGSEARFLLQAGRLKSCALVTGVRARCFTEPGARMRCVGLRAGDS
jgi:hypothetical protein